MPRTRRTLLLAMILAGALAALPPSARAPASPQGPEADVWVTAETTDLPKAKHRTKLLRSGKCQKPGAAWLLACLGLIDPADA